MSGKADLTTVFARLKAILEPYASRLVVIADTADNYSLNTRHIMKNKKPLYFAGVARRKNYVSFYLMSVYARPDLLSGMSTELKKRMQGKSCFNFSDLDEKLFRELAKLTKAGFARFSDEKYIAALREMQ